MAARSYFSDVDKLFSDLQFAICICNRFSFLEGSAQFSTRFHEELAGFFGAEVALDHDDGDFDVSGGFIDGGEGFLARQAGDRRDDAGSAVAQLVVGGFQIDHEIFVNLAELDHDQRGDGVEDEFRRRPGL